MSLPNKHEEYLRLLENLRLGQEAAARLMMLNQAEGDDRGMMIGRGWFHVQEGLKRMQDQITKLATKGITLQ